MKNKAAGEQGNFKESLASQHLLGWLPPGWPLQAQVNVTEESKTKSPRAPDRSARPINSQDILSVVTAR